ncbi:MAG: serine hydrolase domain-containing protein [Streptosporangiaceae bacterium]
MGSAGLDRAVDLVRARGVSAQLCVLRDGQPILDEAMGCPPDALFLIFSTSKPFVALLVHLLAERGQLSLDDRVAGYWPGFGAHGKDRITIRQILQHRSGLTVARNLISDALAATDWDEAVRRIEQARPKFPPGAVPAYHVLSYGFILGEIVRRVSGVPVRDFLASQFLSPLGLQDTHLGLPPGSWARHIPVRGRGPGARLSAAFFNRPGTRQAVIPAAGVSSTARDLARFYQVLLCGGVAGQQEGGRRILSPPTLEEARQPSSDGAVDQYLQLPVRWSQGFQLGGSSLPGPGRQARGTQAPGTQAPGAQAQRRRGTPESPLGRLASPLTFGHNGSNCCLAWADPQRRLVFAYLTDLLSPGQEGARHQAEVSDAVIAACS